MSWLHLPTSVGPGGPEVAEGADLKGELNHPVVLHAELIHPVVLHAFSMQPFGCPDKVSRVPLLPIRLILTLTFETRAALNTRGRENFPTPFVISRL